MNNKKHLLIKIISTALCILVTLQLFGCSDINSIKSVNLSFNKAQSSQQSSLSEVASVIQSSQQNVSSSKISSSSKKTPSIVSNKVATSSSKSTPSTASVNTSPVASNEIRGIWVATAFCIDFPQKAIGIENQKQLIIQILDDTKKYGLNTVFFQVRPMADSLYKSDVFPWSKYLTGTQGKDPGYDPLEYLIDEAHKRNISVQAWINPYRVCEQSDYNTLSASNPAKLHPDWTVTYTDSSNNQNWIWFNPALPEVRNLITQGVTEIVKNYKIDGIHFDDYFYPYNCTYYENSAAFSGIKFNDSAAYKQYGNGLSIADFRRNNINLLIKQVHDSIKSINGNTQFGISPFGIWATKSVMPQGTATTGTSSYSDLYADSRLWVTSHWVDYICPQIYWGFNQPSKPNYNVMVDWWNDLCTQSGVALLIGHRSDIVTGGKNYWTNSSGINQVQYARQKSAYKGSVFYSYNALSSMAPFFKGLYY